MQKIIQPFEVIGAMKAYEEKRLLIADEMGMYKTAQAVLVNNKIREDDPDVKALVICPTSVKAHWAREISEWGYPRNQEITIINAKSYANDVERAKRSQWSIINYPLLSALDSDGLNGLIDRGFKHLILDEAHNAKNPDAIRTRAALQLSDRAEYVTLLSGTPIPNTIADIYVLMHLLNPEKYVLIGEKNIDREARRRFLNLYWERPQELKELLNEHMIRRSTADYIPQNVPSLEVKNVYLDIEGEWLEPYDSLLEQNMPLGRKLMQLEKCLLDTELVNPLLLDSLPKVSPKYEELDEIIAKETEKGKVLVFTNLKEGVVDKLLERYQKYGAIAITGDILTYGENKRERLRQQFQQDPDTKVLIATTAMHEGVDLTAANAVVNLMLPWTPAEYEQRIKRSQRPGEVEKDNVVAYNLIAKYNKRGRKSLEEAQWEMLKGKERNIKYLLSGIKLSREELLELSEPTRVPRIKYALKSDNSIIFEHYLRWRGIGTERALKRLNLRPGKAKKIAEMYQEFNMARNSADLYLSAIEEIKPDTPWLDLAGGPGMLGYYSQKQDSVYTLDLDVHMLNKGQELGTSNGYVQASFSNIPFANQSFGLVTCSLAFQMSEPKKERARILKEMNRVLKHDGEAIITLPVNYLGGQDKELFDNALSQYGFKPIEKYCGREVGPSKLDVYVLRKTGNYSDVESDLTFAGDRTRYERDKTLVKNER